jgi:N-acetylmuramoyl-L-alanine amidase
MAKVCLDPGHGQWDPGAVGPTGYREKDFTLSLALKLKKYLENCGIQIVMTRSNDNALVNGDTNKDLIARANVANRNGCTHFISLHANSAADASAHGTETYCLSPNAATNGNKLAHAVEAALIKEIGLTDRGVKTANYSVLRNTSMPAILVESAFISNPKEEGLLNSVDFQNKCARGIAKGYCAFANIAFKDL